MYRYPPVGYCIYCGSTTPPFGDEHIIARAFGGHLLLPEASCRACEAITGSLEQKLARGQYRIIRRGIKTKDGRPITRRPKEMLSHFPIHKDGKEALIPFEKTPFICLFPELPPPGLLIGRSEVPDPIPIRIRLFNMPKKSNQETFGASTISFSQQFNVPIFHRVLAKIAHAYAAAQFHREKQQPKKFLLPDFIRFGANDKDVARLIGGVVTEPPVPVEMADQLHLIKPYAAYVDGREYFVVLFKFFALLGGPTYQIVAAEV